MFRVYGLGLAGSSSLYCCNAWPRVQGSGFRVQGSLIILVHGLGSRV